MKTNRRTRNRLAAPVVAGLTILGLALTGCDTSGSEAAEASTEAATVSIDDMWVKAADSGMTAAFGVLSTSSDADVRIVAASSEATPKMELHEMATDDDGKMVMRAKKGGFVIPAGGHHKLDPGGDHLMLMDITDPVKPGDDVKITLKFGDGSTKTFTAPARTFSGASEDYKGGGENEDGGERGSDGHSHAPGEEHDGGGHG